MLVYREFQYIPNYGTLNIIPPDDVLSTKNWLKVSGIWDGSELIILKSSLTQLGRFPLFGIHPFHRCVVWRCCRMERFLAWESGRDTVQHAKNWWIFQPAMLDWGDDWLKVGSFFFLKGWTQRREIKKRPNIFGNLRCYRIHTPIYSWEGEGDLRSIQVSR